MAFTGSDVGEGHPQNSMSAIAFRRVRLDAFTSS